MKVGINLPAQFPFDSTNMMLPLYEEMGADSYWAPDHILGVFHPGLWSEIPLSAMADLNARRGDRDMTGPLDAANVAMWVVEPLSPQRTKPADD